MNNLGTFNASEEALAREMWEFRTCQRADGSYYGTGGQCRKGTETTKPEKETKKGKGGGGGSVAEGKKEEKELRSAMGGGYEAIADRATDNLTDVADELSEGGDGNTFGPAVKSLVQEKLEETGGDPMDAGLAAAEEIAGNGFAGTKDIYAIGTGRSLDDDMGALQAAYEKQGLSPKKAKDKVDNWYDDWVYQ